MATPAREAFADARSPLLHATPPEKTINRPRAHPVPPMRAARLNSSEITAWLERRQQVARRLRRQREPFLGRRPRGFLAAGARRAAISAVISRASTQRSTAVLLSAEAEIECVALHFREGEANRARVADGRHLPRSTMGPPGYP